MNNDEMEDIEHPADVQLFNTLKEISGQLAANKGAIAALTNKVLEQQSLIEAAGLGQQARTSSASGTTGTNQQSTSGNAPAINDYFPSAPSGSGSQGSYSNPQGGAFDMQHSQTIGNMGHSPPLAQRHKFPGESSIPEKTRRKILNELYVDFAELLDNDESGYFLKFPQDLDQRAVELHPIPKKRAMNFEDWTQAFNLFRACHLTIYETLPQKILEASNDLMAYQEQIHKLAKLGFDWYFYDTSFRKRRQPGAPFSKVEPDLHSQAVANGMAAYRQQGAKAPDYPSSEGRSGKFRSSRREVPVTYPQDQA